MNGSFLGIFELNGTLSAAVTITDADSAPGDSNVSPTYRIYGDGALITNGTGSLSKLDTTAVTGATNASPIVITAASHGLETGNRVVISSVGGNTAANGTFTITKVNANSFSLDGSTGNGAYTSGGTAHVAGLYSISHSLSSGSGFEAGQCYTVRVDWTLNSDPMAACHSFLVG